MTDRTALEEGRDLFRRERWTEAYALLSAADEEDALAPPDLERLATSAFLIGRDDECEELWTRAHHSFLEGGDPVRAARCAFWLASTLFHRGEHARGGGWIARARRLVDESGRDCVERGFLLLPVAMGHIREEDNQAAHDVFQEAVAIGERFRDPDLVALARHGRARMLIRLGRTGEGVSLLDEVMVGVTAGEVSPVVLGEVYCGLIEACHEIYDLRRAQEWTAALAEWCAERPDLVPYRGQCLVRRAEILQLRGDWPDAMEEVDRACDWLTRPPGQPAAGAAFYQRGELHRLRGAFDDAEEAYRAGSQWGRKPQPGLAQLRLAQRRIDAARSAIRRVVDEARVRRARSRVLGAYAEIMLAAGDLQAAREGAEELSMIAEELDADPLRAASTVALGAVLLAEGEAKEALVALRRGWDVWRELEATYEAARAQVLIGVACRELGDLDTAAMELEAARRVFEELGATPDLERLDELRSAATRKAPGGLTKRELEVLRLVAQGKTNRSIAGELFISEKTVARHVSNIFAKLGVSTRAAATAYAFQNGLV